jgi:hypothetical protein
LTKRWDVEVSPDSFHDVGADEMRVGHGGALEFYIEGRLEIVYAPGQYIVGTFGYQEGNEP